MPLSLPGHIAVLVRECEDTSVVLVRLYSRVELVPKIGMSKLGSGGPSQNTEERLLKPNRMTRQLNSIVSRFAGL